MASTFTWPDGNADATKVELLTTTYILQIYIHMCKITVIKVPVPERQKTGRKRRGERKRVLEVISTAQEIEIHGNSVH